MRRITKLGSVFVGIAAGAAAVVWLIKDRILGPEAAPVRSGEAPAFRVSPASAPAAAKRGADDLSAVKGIGPVYRARLEEAGVTTFAGLAAMSAEQVAEAAGVSSDRAKDWVKQAAAFAR